MTPTLQLFLIVSAASVFYRLACCIKPASRDFYSNRDRDDARGCELEFHRVLAFRSATHPPTGVMIAIFSIAISAGEAADWPRHGYCRLRHSEQRTSINTTSSRMNPGIAK
jgi:hypothetical protein